MPTDTATWFTPTEKDMDAVHYGIPVTTLGEDGDMLALGHHSPRRAVAAFNRHSRVFLGLANILDDRSADSEDAADMLASTVQGWGGFRKPPPELEEDPDFEWVMEACEPDAEYATPYTVLRLS